MLFSLPPLAIADVEVPKPVILFLAVFKSLTSVQLVPFHNSVKAFVGGSPPAIKAAVEVPTPAAFCLPAFKSLTSAQLVPFHNSV